MGLRILIYDCQAAVNKNNQHLFYGEAGCFFYCLVFMDDRPMVAEVLKTVL